MSTPQASALRVDASAAAVIGMAPLQEAAAHLGELVQGDCRKWHLQSRPCRLFCQGRHCPGESVQEAPCGGRSAEGNGSASQRPSGTTGL